VVVFSVRLKIHIFNIFLVKNSHYLCIADYIRNLINNSKYQILDIYFLLYKVCFVFWFKTKVLVTSIKFLGNFLRDILEFAHKLFQPQRKAENLLVLFF